MWKATATAVPGGAEYRVSEDGEGLSFRQFLDHLASNTAFTDWYSSVLAAFDGGAFYWEFPPLTRSTMDDHSRFVLIDAPMLARLPADPTPFNAYFEQNSDQDIVVFPNLGADATLVVPVPRVPQDAWPHFVAFLREADQQLIRSLWRSTARTLIDQISDRPIWLNTAGGGVNWLHVRLDSRPKYYQHRPYTVAG